ncbi:hypothetical protein [Methanoculleus chikugoensis]|uniref:hypothetical protein n=1 Tax=Methanoculleus chikugoensis TaxID=118126 RepID=UPI001FB273D9|nr:hypothetical protein [Methanoculleus chikugoensis]
MTVDNLRLVQGGLLRGLADGGEVTLRVTGGSGGSSTSALQPSRSPPSTGRWRFGRVRPEGAARMK